MIINSFHTYFNSGLSGKTVVMIIQDSRVRGAEEGTRDEWEKQIRRRGDGEMGREIWQVISEKRAAVVWRSERLISYSFAVYYIL
jgi:hypothetical protein